MSDLLEHNPHVGDRYRAGINGRKIAIVGHSHYFSEEPGWTGDYPELTIDVVKRVNSGKCRYSFFTAISRAFGSEPQGFYDQVAFFNFIPNVIGSYSEMSREPTDAQISAAKARMIRLLDQLSPDVTFVFSTRARNDVPSSSTEKEWTYLTTDRRDWIQSTLVAGRHFLVGAKHPQGAARTYLKDVVRLGTAASGNAVVDR